MLYFQLPRTYLFTYKNIDYIESNILPSHYISNSVSHYLQNIKERINEHERDWEIYKRYTNPFEYIHTNVPNKKKSVSKYKPLSRSYFKMVEIIQFFDLLPKESSHTPPSSPEYSMRTPRSVPIISDNYTKDVNIILPPQSVPYSYYANPYQTFANATTSASFNSLYMASDITREAYHNIDSSSIRSFHLAEGPGGFIEAFLEIRNNKFDIYTGMTILDHKNDTNIPSWKKSGTFMKEHCKNVFIENGIDKTGNILHFANFVYCVKKYGSSMDFITADGGFDFSTDFNSQENNIIHLIFAQIAYAVCMQKNAGNFVLKIFDAFYLHTIDLLYLLSSLYETVYICKPHTSRYANSEKYIVCKNFLFSGNDELYHYFHVCFQKMVENSAKPESLLVRFLNIPLSNLFITRLEEYNCIFAQQQIETIYNTISLIETKNNKMREDEGAAAAATIMASTPKYPRKMNVLNRKIGETAVYNKNSNHLFFNDETTFVQEKIQLFIKNNIKKSTQWCKQYKMPYNIFYNDIS